MKNFTIPNFYDTQLMDLSNNEAITQPLNHESPIYISNVLNITTKSFEKLLKKVITTGNYNYTRFTQDKNFSIYNNNFGEDIVQQGKKKIKLQTEIDNVCIFFKETRLNINSIIRIIEAVSKKEADEMWEKMERFAVENQFKEISNDYKDLIIHVSKMFNCNNHNLTTQGFHIIAGFKGKEYCFEVSDFSDVSYLIQLESDNWFIDLNNAILNEKLKNKLVIKNIKTKKTKI